MYIYGAGGHARAIIDIPEAYAVSIEGIFDDRADIRELLGYPVKPGAVVYC